MTPADVLRIVDAGGTLALCVVVWTELRRVRDVLDDLRSSSVRLSERLGERTPTGQHEVAR